jgi:hypothetical protein
MASSRFYPHTAASPFRKQQKKHISVYSSASVASPQAIAVCPMLISKINKSSMEYSWLAPAVARLRDNEMQIVKIDIAL